MITDLQRLRDAAQSGGLVALARASLIQTFGPSAREVVESPAATEALRDYGNDLLAMGEAIAAFNADAKSAERIAEASTTFANTHRVLIAVIERAARATLGIAEH